MAQTGKLILDGVTFMLDDRKDTYFFIYESEEYKGTFRFSFGVCFQAERYQDEWVSPAIHINSYETGKANVEELVGCTYQVNDLEESDEREDTLYVFEHEPMEEYSFTILEVSNQMVHIQIEGIAIVDGYADPYETAPFSGDFWLHYE